ncbi:hypothetical protein [Aquicella lusitana]|uniref:YD repeat-containing protein n=1 Tax=Aquicella lusitana TaxID=254246 RepID=A0A370GNC0_9COXI|nr:hypothetical protein [Aquicella lusitana]RDI45222.1 hypothetical protein C8D86_107102 [Aquicella lusitana]VVC72708.1 hypothetical protein AQULUS_04280 [Aquicella lusitana]
MATSLKKIIGSVLLLSAMSAVAAQEGQMTYKQRQLPDGSVETEYNGPDGSKMRQVQRANGVVETYVTDAQGNSTITTQHPGGQVEVKTKGP